MNRNAPHTMGLDRLGRAGHRLLAPLLPAGDLVMMKKQLRTRKALAERDAA